MNEITQRCTLLFVVSLTLTTKRSVALLQRHTRPGIYTTSFSLVSTDTREDEDNLRAFTKIFSFKN